MEAASSSKIIVIISNTTWWEIPGNIICITKFVEINLHHSKATMAEWHHKLAMVKTDTALIQEAWVCQRTIRGVNAANGIVLFCHT
jgi:hypothetical protein